MIILSEIKIRIDLCKLGKRGNERNGLRYSKRTRSREDYYEQSDLIWFLRFVETMNEMN